MARIKNSPECQNARRWLQGQEGRSCFAGFTGQDSPAFSIFIHAVELYLRSDPYGREGALLAMRGALMAIQPKYHELCRQVIPAIGDWGHQEEIWPLIHTDRAVLSRKLVREIGPCLTLPDPIGRTHSSINDLIKNK